MAYVRKRTTKAGSHALRQPILASPGERAINRYEGEPEGLSIRLAFVGRFLLLADDDAP